MSTALSPARVHRLRRIVGWLAVLLLGFALATAALAGTRGTSAQARSPVWGQVSIEAAFHGAAQQRFTALASWRPSPGVLRLRGARRGVT
jgi:hypothetical protein